jgi:glycerate kinase
MEEVGFEEKMRDADLIITGEGKLDDQTLSGKVIMGVGKAAKKLDIPVLALCGQLDLDHLGLNDLGVLSAFSIIQQPCTLDTAFLQTADWTTDIIENLIRVIIFFRKEI